jgi:hypothetical protein
MRAGPLSSPKVIDLLNRFFVPVFVVNEDYRPDGPAPKEEKDEYRRIYHEALRAKLSAGTVHAYLIETAGHPIDSLHVADATQPDRLAAMLERAIREQKLAEGQALVPPRALSAPPECAAGSLVLHLVARGHGNSWDGFPSEDWIVLGRREVEAVLPAQCAGVVAGTLRVPSRSRDNQPDPATARGASLLQPPVAGRSWDVPEDVATSILTHFYPQTENNDVSTHRFERRKLRGTIEWVKDGIAHARLEGEVRMTHQFYPGRKDANMVSAPCVGYLEFEPSARLLLRLRLATDRATYGKGTLDVAVSSVP